MLDSQFILRKYILRIYLFKILCGITAIFSAGDIFKISGQVIKIHTKYHDTDIHVPVVADHQDTEKHTEKQL